MEGAEKKFTLEELKQYDGKNGRPAYIAYKGKVYDVTDDYLWIDGDHQGEHVAGKDLTEEMTSAPMVKKLLKELNSSAYSFHELKKARLNHTCKLTLIILGNCRMFKPTKTENPLCLEHLEVG